MQYDFRGADLKKWVVSNAPVSGGADVVREFGEFLGGVLIRRGFTTLDAAREFFGCAELSDPYLMKDVEEAVALIRDALDDGRKIAVYGDYDCDGVTATAIMFSYLEAQGADVEYYIPERGEGFGMNVPALERLIAKGVRLVITVDNGISAIKEAQFLKEKGVDLIITDHHQPDEELPECAACVDPNRVGDNSPFKDLCGAGVALKLLIALEEDEEFVLDTYAHLAALGTVADVVPLKGENRFIVRRGLENMRLEQNAGLTALLRAAALEPQNLTSTSLAFRVCPRINAAGRVASAEKALRLLLCEDDVETARRIAEELTELNSKRASEEERVLNEIDAQIAADPLIAKQRVIVAAGEDWHHGVVGLACSKLLERYGKPVVIISVTDGEASGSMRSVDGFSAHKMLTACSACLTKFGGHPKAGGFSLRADKVKEFTRRIYEYAREFYPKMPDVSVCADMEVTLDMLSLDNVKSLSKLEPCGERNPAPVFLLRGCKLKAKYQMSNGKFTMFDITQGATTLRVKTFRIPFARFQPKPDDMIDLIVSAKISDYNDTESVELWLEDYRPAGFREDRFLAASRVYEEICRGEGCDKRLAPRVIPQSREELMKIYDLVRRADGKQTPEELAIFDGSVNYCMLRVTLDAFAEAKMIEYINGAPKTVPAEKRDLFQSGLLAELQKLFA